jgi:hypothetical protein
VNRPRSVLDFSLRVLNTSRLSLGNESFSCVVASPNERLLPPLDAPQSGNVTAEILLKIRYLTMDEVAKKCI